MFLYVAKGEQEKDEWKQQHENGPNYGLNAYYIEGGDVLKFIEEATAKERPKSRRETFEAARDAPTYQEGVAILWKNEPEQMLKYGPNIEKNLKKYKGGNHSMIKYNLHDFERLPLDLSKPVVLPGKANMGKTQFLKAHASHPIIIKTMDDLLKITDDTDLLIFDDMNFGPGTEEQPGLNLTADQIIALLTIDDNVSIKTRPNNRGESADIRAGLKRAFSTNVDLDGMFFDIDEQVLDVKGNPLHIFPRGANAEQQRGIDRRYKVEKFVEEPLFNKEKVRFRKAIVYIVNTLVSKTKEIEMEL